MKIRKPTARQKVEARMANPDHSSTQELIAAIEKKDKRFRFFQSLFMVGTFTILIFLVLGQAQTINGVQAQVKQSAKLAAETRIDREAQLKTITRRLDCILVFFSQKDRTNLSVTDVDKCALSTTGNVNDFFTPTSTDGSNSNPTINNQPGIPTPAATIPPSTDPTTPITPAPVATGGDDPNKGLLNLGLCVLGVCL